MRKKSVNFGLAPASIGQKHAIILILIYLFLIAPCCAGVITVDDDGPADFNSIQPAIDVASEGDTIIVAPGTYPEKIDFLGKNIMLTSIDPTDYNIISATTIGLDDFSTYLPDVAFSGTEDETCMLIGFNINGWISGGGWGGSPHTHATISNCLLRNNCGRCLTVIMNCDGTISNCIIVDNSYKCACGCKCPAIKDCFGLIKNCTIMNNLYGAVEVNNGTTTIENSILGSTMSDLPFVDGVILLYDGSRLNISYSNISYDEIQRDWKFDCLDPCDCIINWGPGNIDTDPCLVQNGFWDPNGTPEYPFDDFWVDGDYHLLEDSLCINAGDPNYTPSPGETDLDGNPRIIDGRIDMGAYEFNPPIEADLRILPRVINRHRQRPRIMAWLRLPAGITKDQVDEDIPLLLYPGEIESNRQYIYQSGRRGARQTNIFAFFDKSKFLSAIVDNGRIELQAVGKLKSGRLFQGLDTIRIINRPRRRRHKP